MRRFRFCSPLFAVTFAATTIAADSVGRTGTRDLERPAVNSNVSERKASGQARPAARGPLPDPVLLDGSTAEPEKRPEFGMLAEFEMAGDEQPSDRIGPKIEQPGAGGEQEKAAQASSQGGKPPRENDPNAKAEGMQVAELKIDEQADPGGGNSSSAQKPQQVALGDAAMQIKPIANVPNIVGAQQPGTSQQFEKPVAAGKQQGNNRNQGSERGRTMPPGM